MGLYGGRPASELTLTDAIMTGFRMALQLNFVIPILVIGVVINAVVYAAFVPLITSIALGNTNDVSALGGSFVAGILGAIIAGVIGGIILNLYGQMWATMASVGEAPSIQAAFARVGQRWVAILGAGIVVAVASLGLFIVGGLISAALGAIVGALGLLGFIAAIVAAIYVGARLSLSGWMAADGAAAMDAVRGSWEVSSSRVLLILGWGLVAGIVFSIVGAVLGSILGIIPLIGQPIATTIGTAFGYGSGVTIFRKVTSHPASPSMAPAAPVA
ncbi:MAG: hypothetical protein HYX57_12515 [Chloroflexi bacterium]|nr:hypothetical protein [Chloroflexota bacterium]